MSLFQPIFRSLNDSGVRYVVVGGLATVLHGHARFTADIDLIVDLAPDQARKAVTALVGLGFQPQVPVNPESFADPETRNRWIQEKGMQVFSMVDRTNPIRVVDLFVQNPITFEDLWARSVVVELEATTIRVASIPDLIRLKRLSNRPQDLADIEKLEEIQKLKEGEPDG